MERVAAMTTAMAGQVAMGGQGSILGSPSPLVFRVQYLCAQKKESEKKRGRPWEQHYSMCWTRGSPHQQLPREKPTECKSL